MNDEREEWADAARLVRDGVPDQVGELDEDLARAARGAARLGAELATWEAPAPPEDLIERTLARMALAGARPAGGAEDPAPEKAGELISFPTPAPAARRSTVVEVLTSAPLADAPAVAPTPRRLLLRVVLQSAAAVLFFALTSAFVAVYYPAITHALQERDLGRCQAQLRRLHAAAQRYREEHPAGPRLRGADLRRALIQGGYASERDFTCPSRRGQKLGARSYQGDLPAGVAAVGSGAQHPLFWDTPSNHDTAFNVVRQSGRVQSVPVEDLGVLWRERGAEESEGGE
ncbi:MAG: hypothetical protein AB7N76_04100 [Planctomycetota bacterium]